MYNKLYIEQLNHDIANHFPHLKRVEPDFHLTFSGVSRLVMLDRYAQKDKTLVTLKTNDIVITIIKDDPVFPIRGIGTVKSINRDTELVEIMIEEEYEHSIDHKFLKPGTKNVVIKNSLFVEKPLEIYYEQIAWRVASALAKREKIVDKVTEWHLHFYNELKNLHIIPAGRVLYGAGSDSDVTFFNCFVMPMIRDSREGISQHRQEVMEIMSHGGGVGTNGSTLRPKGTIAKTVGGKSSGAVSWLNDLSTLTHLVEQGGSRRGAQMIMMADWHPDIIEFIISKMQNPRILKWLSENATDSKILNEANRKIKFIPLTTEEQAMYEKIVENDQLFSDETVESAKQKLLNGGTWEVNNPNFLTGANISVAISHEFMKKVETNDVWELRFPDLANYTKEQKAYYDQHWHEVGNIYEWEKLGFPIKTYYKINARELWDFINFCANYSAEPGIFFIDTANDLTNARAYDMKVVATNPCGEQPLAPYSVCNLAAINLSEFVDKQSQTILYDKLKRTVEICVRMQDNVIDTTPYFLEANRKQALGERRVGLGVMGLHDLLIWAGYRYGSKECNKVINKLFQLIAETAYETSSDLAVEKGSFPFLNSTERFINTGYMKTMNQSIRDKILKQGIRNSHLLTIAPTGSTGTMVGVSTGLEPYFGFKFYRSGRLGKFIEVNAQIVSDWLKYHPEYTKENLPDIFVSAMELSPEAHVDVQCTIQRWIDSSISKTVNAPRGYSVKDVEKIYSRLYKQGAKGGTVYVDGSRDSQVLSLTNDEKQTTEQLDINDYGVEPASEMKSTVLPESLIETAKLRGVKQDRRFGLEIGDVCPICKEGTVIEAGGCSTCNNCNSQLKCGL